MLYLKLTLRNVMRSIKEYMIFMITICISMMLMYAFQSLVYSTQLQDLLHQMDTLYQVILLVSVLLVFIIGWLISYVSGFIIQNRSREFGLYMLFGMKRSTIAGMFVLEMFLMGLAGFVIGCLLGTLFSQVLTAIIYHLFEGAYTFVLEISFPAIGLTFLCFLLMWIVTLYKERRTIMKISVHELLYEDRKNDTSRYHQGVSWFMLISACFSFGLGLYLTSDAIRNMTRNDASPWLLPGIILLVLSVYCFYYGLFVLLETLIKRNQKLKYQKNTLVLYGHIKGRIKANRIVLATLSLLMIITLTASSFAVKFQEATMAQIDEISPYDIYAMSANDIDIAGIQNYFQDKGYQLQEHVFYTYQFDQAASNLDRILDMEYNSNFYDVQFIRFSDYQQLLALKDKPVPVLKDGQYILLTRSVFYEKFTKNIETINVSVKGKALELASIDDTDLGQAMDDFLLVIPDAMIKDARQTGNRYAANTDIETTAGMEQDLLEGAMKNNGMIILRVKADTIHDSMLSFVTLIFMLYYLAFIFICVSATIMATQQMMDATRQKSEYELLHKLGMQKKEVYQCLRKQIAVYFFIPMLLPLFYLFPILRIMDVIFRNLSGGSSIYAACFLSALLYFLVYFCYYLLAYVGCKKNLHLE